MLGLPASLGGPERVVIDSRAAGPGDLFVGLRGANTDGGRFAPQAARQGAWGILATLPDAEQTARAQQAEGRPPAVVLAAKDPLRSLQRLATAWRRHLGAKVIGVTGSTGKTSTKDLVNAILIPHRRVVASRANFNTEIGLPLEILEAPEETEVLVLEMGMRGPGQIADLATIAEPDVAVVVSLGPVHLELLGSMEAIAAAKAELIAGLPSGGVAIIPVDEPLLDPHRRQDVRTLTFGKGADVQLRGVHGSRIEIDLEGETIVLEVSLTQAHQRLNLLAAVAAARAVGVTPTGKIAVRIGPGRGQRQRLPDSVTLIDDSYNANPMSMRAALEDLAQSAEASRGGRRVAILGDMLELGPDERRYHQEVGEQARRAGVDLLITVGGLAVAMADGFEHGEVYATADAGEAAALAQELLRPHDTVLVKASRGVGLELVCAALSERAPV